jgi:carbon-monoxide dehydrogenase small subunit
MNITLTVNRKTHHLDVEPRTLLADVLRETLDLTGTKIGCDTGHCGSCVVMVNGRSLKSCMALAVQADGATISTVEGLADNGKLNSLQEGFWERHGTQCGFCTSGMLMSLTDMLQRNPNPDEAEIRRWLEGNLCRCTGYQNVVSAAQYAIEKTQSPARMITDTPAKEIFQNRVRLLLSGDADRLVDEHYHDDAVLVGFDFTVRGKDALRKHFRNLFKWVKFEEVLSTDKFTETESSYFYEATVRTNSGVSRVFDAYYLRDQKIVYHFTGMIN